MPGLADKIARVGAAANRADRRSAPSVSNRLSKLVDFGSNPGQLRAFQYVPANLAASAALVVVLHGCSQAAAGYDHGSGWSQLADDYGFALLFPEQQAGNNMNGCFNWFEPADTRRDSGEALSIRQMIATMQSSHSIDPARIFITGLSAGGAMASSMLATYPEVFAGGAIIAGLPHGVATNMMQAFARMGGHGLPTAATLAEKIADASDNIGPWPRISIWHGEADMTVNVANAGAIALQWRRVQGLPEQPNDIEIVDGASRRAWRDSRGGVVLEEYIVPGMGHGTPLKLSGPSPYGAAGPYMLDVGISSTVRMAETWSLMTTEQADTCLEKGRTDRSVPLPVVKRNTARRLHGMPIESAPGLARPTSVAEIINSALHTAGLLK